MIDKQPKKVYTRPYKLKHSRYIEGWLWCSGNTEVCGTFITGSIPVSHPWGYLSYKKPDYGLFYLYLLSF